MDLIAIGTALFESMKDFALNSGWLGIGVFALGGFFLYILSSGVAEFADKILKIFAIILFIGFLIMMMIKLGTDINITQLYSEWWEQLLALLKLK